MELEKAFRIPPQDATVAKLVDAIGLGPIGRNAVLVRVQSVAPSFFSMPAATCGLTLSRSLKVSGQGFSNSDGLAWFFLSQMTLALWKLSCCNAFRGAQVQASNLCKETLCGSVRTNG